MKCPRPRLTVRRMMVAVLGFGLALHVALAAWRAHRHGGDHLHSAIYDLASGPGWGAGVRRQPFWPTFWRLTTGWSWADRKACWIGAPAMMEMCELDAPEIRAPLGPYTFAAVYTKEQVEFFEERRKAFLDAAASKPALLEKMTAWVENAVRLPR